MLVLLFPERRLLLQMLRLPLQQVHPCNPLL
jgi:hypothetical protein